MALTLRCTAKLIARLKRLDDRPPASTTTLGDWYGNLIRIGRHHVLLFISEKSRLPVLLRARDAGRLAAALPDAVAEMLAAIGIDAADIERERRAMSPIAVGPTASRSLLGTLNEFTVMANAELVVNREPGLPHIARWLAQTPIGSLGAFPIDMTRELFRTGGTRVTPAVETRTYRLKVTLLESPRPIWRRFEVPADVHLADLHRVLQIVMRWTNSHLHSFEHKGRTYGERDPDGELDFLDEKRTRLSDLLVNAGESLDYEYDFGDSWAHRVVLEGVTMEPARPAARVVDARGACPPEDVGGVSGYAEFLRAIANPSHPEHKMFVEWIGGGFDAEAYDVAPVNAKLSRLRLAPARPKAGAWPAGLPLPKRAKPSEPRARERADILTDREVTGISEFIQAHFGHILPINPLLADDLIRWGPVAVKCEQARGERQWTRKDAARTLGIPQYRLKAVEDGPSEAYRPEDARRYFSLLGLDSWIAKWVLANLELARRMGLA